MRTAVRRGLKILGFTVLAVVVVALVGVWLMTGTDAGRERVRRFALDIAKSRVHGVLRIGRIEGNLLTGVIAKDVSITDSSGAPFLVADELRTGYGLGSFLQKKILLRNVTLVRPVIVLDKPPGGEWNFKRIFAKNDTATVRDTTIGWGDWIEFRNVKIVQGKALVRTAWHPDTALGAAAQDSAIARALGGESRNRVERVAGGFQKVMSFDRIDATMPRIRLADPGEKSKLMQVATLQMIAEPFRPPFIDVRDLKGTFEFTGDSLWFTKADARLPGSHISGDGKYVYATSGLGLQLRGAPVATADLRWLYPRLPANGTGTLDFAMTMDDSSSDYLATNADVRIGDARATGSFGLAKSDTIAFHDTDLRISNLDTRLIEQLVPNFRSPRRGALGGHVAATGGIHALQLDADVSFADVLAGTSRAIVVGEVGAVPGGGIRARALRVRAEPVQVALARGFMPTLPIGGVVRGAATIDGTTQTRLVFAGNLTHDDGTARSRITGRGAVRLAGGSWFDVDVSAQPVSLVTVGRFVPALGLRGSAVGPIRLTGSMRDLRVSSDLRFSDGGGLDVRGRLDLASAQKGYDLTATMRLFNANLVIAKAPTTSLSARATVAGRGFDPNTMTIRASADVMASQYDSLAIDSAAVRVTIANGMLNAQRVVLAGSRAQIVANGTFGLAPGKSGEIVVRGSADSLARFARWFPRDTVTVQPRPARRARLIREARADSARIADATAAERAVTGAPAPKLVVKDVPRATHADSVRGRLQLAGTIRGGISRFDARARVAAESLAVAGNTANALRADIAWTNARTPQSTLAVGAQLDAASVKGFILDSVDARVSYANRAGTMNVAVWQDHEREYGVGGRYALHTDHKELHLADMRLRLDTNDWQGTRPSAIRWGGHGVRIDSLELRNASNGRIFVNGLVPTEGRASLRFAVDQFPVQDLEGLLQSDLEMAGIVSVSGEITGTLRRPVFRVAYGVAGGQWRGTRLPDVHGTLNYADRLVAARAVMARNGGAPLATVDGRLPIDLAFQRESERSRVGRGPVAIDLVADSLPLELIPQLTDAIADVRGRAAGKLVVRGTMQQPRMSGALALDRGQFRIVPTGMRVVNLAGFIRMRDDTVFVDSIAGRAGGPLRVAGVIALPELTKPEFDLTFFAQNARVLDSERGRLRADAELAFTGPLSSAYISGRTRVRNGVIYLPEPDDKNVVSPNDPAVFAVVDTSVVTDREYLPTQSPLLAGLRMDVTLNVSRDTWVRSKEANVEIFTQDEGLAVHVDRAKQSLALEGVVSTDQGQYTFLTKRFQIRQGSAMFIGATGGTSEPLNPTLQVTGEYPVRLTSRETINIRVIIGGTLARPKLALESDAQPPIPQSDLLSYLAFGRSSSSLLQQEGSSASSGNAGGGLVGTGAALAYKRLAAVAIGVATDQIEGEASRSLGADVLNITPADVPTEVYTPTGIGDFLRGTEVEVGKYIDRRTFLSLQGRLTGTPGVRVQHRLPKGMVLQSSFEQRYPVERPDLDDNSTTRPKPVFGVFLIREWRF
ncbi:MAG TPA: translocation/assembly module TamB domain-containing protein [Gemmatimonadaceae bacterium]|nr:translocation/assembly module TamB domain-containing protein [Gemmatimonadaceae bacterium]